eukprot:scaffold3808_cov112-Isochrysis_galbana.AAC.42
MPAGWVVWLSGVAADDSTAACASHGEGDAIPASNGFSLCCGKAAASRAKRGRDEAGLPTPIEKADSGVASLLGKEDGSSGNAGGTSRPAGCGGALSPRPCGGCCEDGCGTCCIRGLCMCGGGTGCASA